VHDSESKPEQIRIKSQILAVRDIPRPIDRALLQGSDLNCCKSLEITSRNFRQFMSPPKGFGIFHGRFLLRGLIGGCSRAGVRRPFNLNKIEGANALYPVGQLQHFGMAESSDDVVVPGAPVLLHCPSRKLEVLGDAFVTFAVVDQLDDVADFVVYSRFQNLFSCTQLFREFI
jgi:hypothetical protein